MVDVSFILPTYNVEKYIEKAVDALLAQKGGTFEIIIVDDGSTDSSGAIADRLATGDERIKVVHKENGGIGTARNAGMDVAQGEYITFPDPDDFVEPTLISDNIAVAKKHNADLVIFGFYNDVENENGTITNISTCTPNLEGVYTYDEFQKAYPDCCDDPQCVWNKLYRREFLLENGCRHQPFVLGQDVVFNCLVNSKPMKTVVANHGFYYHYINRENSSVNRYHPERLKDNFYITRAYENMIKCWKRDKDSAYKKILYYTRTRDLHVGIKNVCLSKCPLSLKERQKWLKEQMKSKDTRIAVRKAPFNKFPRKAEKIKLFLLKLHLYNAVIWLNSYRSDRGI
ncbi:MAG: glycosyltransferase family 2 protein [Bacillota bacterium]|nr:glycosyltransferase family 2 protein [Bacillota bacterium]